MEHTYDTRNLPHLKGVDLNSLPTATGTVRFDPHPLEHSNVGCQAKGMVVLQCGPGWLDYLLWQARYALPRTWQWQDERSHNYAHEGEHRPWAPYVSLRGGLNVPSLGSHVTIIYPHEYVTMRRNEWGLDEGLKIKFKFHPWPVYSGRTTLSKKASTRREDNRKVSGRQRSNTEGPEARMGHVWYPVWAEDLGGLREYFGLRREPQFMFHLTVGTWMPESKVDGGWVRTL